MLQYKALVFFVFVSYLKQDLIWINVTENSFFLSIYYIQHSLVSYLTRHVSNHNKRKSSTTMTTVQWTHSTFTALSLDGQKSIRPWQKCVVHLQYACNLLTPRSRGLSRFNQRKQPAKRDKLLSSLFYGSKSRGSPKKTTKPPLLGDKKKSCFARSPWQGLGFFGEPTTNDPLPQTKYSLQKERRPLHWRRHARSSTTPCAKRVWTRHFACQQSVSLLEASVPFTFHSAIQCVVDHRLVSEHSAKRAIAAGACRRTLL